MGLALEYLDKAIPPEILEQFTELWRGKSPEEEKKPIVVAPTGLRGADPLAQKVVDYYGNKGWRIKKPSHGGYEVLLVVFEGATRTGNKTFVTNNDSPTGDNFNDLIGVFWWISSTKFLRLTYTPPPPSQDFFIQEIVSIQQEQLAFKSTFSNVMSGKSVPIKVAKKL